MIDGIRELHEAGADLRTGTIQKADVPLSGAVQRYFGTMRKAMAAAGLPYPASDPQALGHWTEELVLGTQREMHANGEDLRYRTVKEMSQPLFHAKSAAASVIPSGGVVSALTILAITYMVLNYESASPRMAGQAPG